MRAYTRAEAVEVVRNGWILDIFLVTYSGNTVCTVHGVLKARMLKWFAIPFSSDPCFIRLSTMTHLSRVALHGMAHSFIELGKVVLHVIILISFL